MYDIMEVPADTPPIKPGLSIDATDGILLVHVPPPVVLDSVVV
jgi:hypothetical protein